MVAKRISAGSRTPADVIRIHDVDYVQDETGELVPYVPPPPRRFAQKDRVRASKDRDRRHGRRWYAKRLLAIAEGNETPTKEQLTALLTLGRLKGWHRRSPGRDSLRRNPTSGDSDSRYYRGFGR